MTAIHNNLIWCTFMLHNIANYGALCEHWTKRLIILNTHSKLCLYHTQLNQCIKCVCVPCAEWSYSQLWVENDVLSHAVIDCQPDLKKGQPKGTLKQNKNADRSIDLIGMPTVSLSMNKTNSRKSSANAKLHKKFLSTVWISVQIGCTRAHELVLALPHSSAKC